MTAAIPVGSLLGSDSSSTGSGGGGGTGRCGRAASVFLCSKIWAWVGIASAEDPVLVRGWLTAGVVDKLIILEECRPDTRGPFWRGDEG